MSEENATSAPEATPEPAAPEPAKTESEKRAAATLAFAERMRARSADPVPAEGPDKPPSSSEKAAEDKPEAEPEAKPEPAKEKRLDRALRDLQRLERENAELKKAGGKPAPTQEYEAELAQARALLAKGKDISQVLEFLDETTGLSYEALTKAIIEGKARPPGPKLPAEVAERIRKLEERDQQREKELAEYQAARAWEAEEKQAKDWLSAPENAEAHPLLAATDWAAGRLVAMARERGGASAEEVALDLEKAMRQNVEAILRDPRAAKALVQSSDKIKAALRDALGVTGQTPTAGASSEPGKRPVNGGRSLSSYSTGSAPPADRSKMTEREKSAHAASEFARMLAAKRKP